MMLRDQRGRQRLGQRVLNLPDQRRHQLLNSVRVQERPFHLLRGIVIGTQSHAGHLYLRNQVDIGMGNVDTAVVSCRPSEHDVLLMHLILASQVLDALEPHQVHKARSVGKVGNQPPMASLSRHLETPYFAFQLDVGHAAVQLTDGVDAAAVHVFIGEIIQQVVQGTDTRFLIEHSGPLRSYARQIFDVKSSQVCHFSNKAEATFRSKGVVILIFSRLPSVSTTGTPIASTTDASSVNRGV